MGDIFYHTKYGFSGKHLEHTTNRKEKRIVFFFFFRKFTLNVATVHDIICKKKKKKKKKNRDKWNSRNKLLMCFKLKIKQKQILNNSFSCAQ